MTLSPNGRIRVLIIDDHAVVREGLRLLIDTQPGMAVVGSAGNCAEALRVAEEEKPDVVLLDLDMGGESGLRFLSEASGKGMGARVIILTGLHDAEAHRRAIRLGAVGLVLKEKASEVLIKAIEKVHAGEAWLDRSMTAAMLGELSSGGGVNGDPDAARIATLTDRECEVIKLIGEGLKNKQIGKRLFISETTVHHHLTSIFSKLGVSDRFELMIYALRHGLARQPH